MGIAAPPRQQSQSRRTSTSPPAKAKGFDGGVVFITGNNPEDFKKKKVMKQVRQKAMDDYLSKNKKVKSEDSTATRNHSVASGSDRQGSTDSGLVPSNEEALRIYEQRSKRRPSSPARSPRSSNGQPISQTSISNMQVQMARPSPSIDSLMASAPIVRPSRTGIMLIYDVKITPPFQSIGTPLDPFKTMPQAPHPRVSVEGLKFHCSRVFGTRAMGQYWIPTLVKSPHAFLSTLCIASAHNDAIQSRPVESVQTLALRQEVMHLISKNLVNPDSRVNDFNIIALTQLIASEIIAGEQAALAYHESGVAAMVRQRGGINKLGVSGRLASTLSWVSLESAILREAKPEAMYRNFCTAATSRNFPPTATLPESPLFRPQNRKGFVTLQRSPRYQERTLRLLNEIHQMMEFFSHATEDSHRNDASIKNLYKRITSSATYPSAAELQKRGNVLTYLDWTYEAIRVTAVLQATAILKRVPLSEALKYAAPTQNLSDMYASSSASRSNESLVSPTAVRHDSPVTGFSTSPAWATSPVMPQDLPQENPFTFVPSTNHNMTASSKTHRPSLSTHASSSFSTQASSSLSLSLSFPSASFSAASTPTTTLLSSLKTALENSDLSACWGDMAGVLLWIGLTVGAASSRQADKVSRKWFAALAVRCSILLCFEHPECVHATLVKMGEVVEGLDVKKVEDVSGKRRRRDE
ncbi:hypothetical protein P154DRAFT_103246 [Amniculicola lignicola CBS 123094]|uniref:Uncharacterized protein n=1 Tax=Amniculicola lignicola CBS 123094 TaxID=1392246 RepID=A0A6A5WW45_9PLEO|nr:hypothetical protein P154DRAFT_103246 [Amniculicola lignicola CBS 123094]